jgi:hypothetical protein
VAIGQPEPSPSSGSTYIGQAKETIIIARFSLFKPKILQKVAFLGKLIKTKKMQGNLGPKRARVACFSFLGKVIKQKMQASKLK